MHHHTKQMIVIYLGKIADGALLTQHSPDLIWQVLETFNDLKEDQN